MVEISSTSSSIPSTASQSQQQSGTKVATVLDNKKKASSEINKSEASNQQQLSQLPKQTAEQEMKTEDQVQQTKQVQLDQLEQLEKFVSSLNKGLSFRLDEVSGKSIITVYELSSGDVIRQIPAEEMLKLTQQISLNASGLVTEKV